MKEKKMKLWTLIVIVILLVLAVFVGTIARKVNILSDIDKKIENQNAKTNMYVKIVSQKQTSERYKKDNKVKFVTPNNTSIVETRGTLGTLYLYKEENGKKIVQKTDNISVHITMLENCADLVQDTLSDRIQLARSTKISSQTVDGKACYVLTQKEKTGYPTWLFPEGCESVTFYVEKATGLPIKRVVQNLDKTQDVMTFEYSFDTVTDEDLKALEGYEEVKSQVETNS